MSKKKLPPPPILREKKPSEQDLLSDRTYIELETNIKFYMNPKISVRNNKYGVGVYAKKSIHKAEVIEQSPAIIVPVSEISKISILNNYFFGLDMLGENISAIGLGYSSLYNHSMERYNAEYGITPYLDQNLDELRVYIKIVAIDDIKINQEILIDYGYDPSSKE